MGAVLTIYNCYYYILWDINFVIYHIVLDLILEEVAIFLHIYYTCYSLSFYHIDSFVE